MRRSPPAAFSMPVLVLVSFALTVLCAIHVVRSGRPLYWIWLLVIGSYIAVVVYVLVAVLPDLRNDPRSRRAARGVIARIDPERQRRRVREQLEVADTTDNRRALAQECLRMGDFEDAAELYRSILKGFYATEPQFMLGLAQAQAGLGDHAGARATLDALIGANPDFRSSDGHLLYAQCLEALGEHDAALAEYEGLARSYPGEEARYRYASLLRRRDRTAEARAVLEDMLKRARLAPRYYRRKEREWLEAAKRDVDALGAG